MHFIQLTARVSVVVLLILIISALGHASTALFHGLASLMSFLLALDAFIGYLHPALSTVTSANKVIAYVVRLSPMSNWNQSPSSLLVASMLFATLAVAAGTRALGYW